MCLDPIELLPVPEVLSPRVSGASLRGLRHEACVALLHGLTISRQYDILLTCPLVMSPDKLAGHKLSCLRLKIRHIFNPSDGFQAASTRHIDYVYSTITPWPNLSVHRADTDLHLGMASVPLAMSGIHLSSRRTKGKIGLLADSAGGPPAQ